MLNSHPACNDQRIPNLSSLRCRPYIGNFINVKFLAWVRSCRIGPVSIFYFKYGNMVTKLLYCTFMDLSMDSCCQHEFCLSQFSVPMQACPENGVSPQLAQNETPPLLLQVTANQLFWEMKQNKTKNQTRTQNAAAAGAKRSATDMRVKKVPVPNLRRNPRRKPFLSLLLSLRRQSRQVPDNACPPRSWHQPAL